MNQSSNKQAPLSDASSVEASSNHTLLDAQATPKPDVQASPKSGVNDEEKRKLRALIIP